MHVHAGVFTAHDAHDLGGAVGKTIDESVAEQGRGFSRSVFSAPLGRARMLGAVQLDAAVSRITAVTQAV